MSDNAPLLTFEVSSNPAVIHASPASGQENLIALSIKVANKTNPHQPIECKSFRLEFQKGSGAQHLFSDENEITPIAPSNWAFTKSGLNFTATPDNIQAGSVTAPLVFQLVNIKVNKHPGIAEFTIIQETGLSGSTGTKKITLAKFPAGANTLLTYDLEPRAVEISPAQGDPSLADLTISVSNSLHKSVGCREISFGFHPGEAAADLCSDATGIETRVESGWDIAQSGGLFIAKPSTGSTGQFGGAGVLFEFKKIKVNAQVGTTAIDITEVTDVDVNNTGSVSKNLGKTPLTLQIKDFRATPPIIDEGDSTTLSWDGTSGASFSIEYENEDGVRMTISHPKGSTQPLPAKGSYAITLQKKTTFHLSASMAGESQSRHSEIDVDVIPVRPHINAFAGSLSSPSSGARRLTLNWDASHTAYCELTDNDSQLQPKVNAHHIDLDPADPASKTFTLTAWDSSKTHSDSLDLIVTSRLQELTSVTTQVNLSGVAVSPDNLRVFVVGIDSGRPPTGYVSAFKPVTLESAGAATFPGLVPNSIAVSPNQQRIYFMADFALWVLDATTLQRIGDPINPGSLGALVAVSPANTPVFVSGEIASQSHLTGCLGKIDAASLQLVGEVFLLPTLVSSMTVSPANQHIYLGCSDNTLRVFATDTQQFVGNPIPLSALPKGIAISPDGKVIYLVSDDHNLSARNADTGADLGDTVALGAPPTGIAISPDGQRLYVTTWDGKLRAFSALSVSNPVKIKSFTATPNQATAGDGEVSVRLAWEAVNARQLLLNDESVTGQSKAVSIQRTTDFTLQAFGPGGPVSDHLTVEVSGPPRIARFEVSPHNVYAPQSPVRLEWETWRANQVLLNGEIVNGNSRQVTIDETTTFTLEARGAGAPAHAERTVIRIHKGPQISKPGSDFAN
jgi:DNA-binding beta-propeller fold protein YncE